jgi:hypothetical protein
MVNDRPVVPGVIVAVRRRLDRMTHLVVRVVGDGWFIGHHPASGLCHHAHIDDVIAVVGWRKGTTFP